MYAIIILILIIVFFPIIIGLITVIGMPIMILGCIMLIILSIWEIYKFFNEKKEIENNIFRIKYFTIKNDDLKKNYENGVKIKIIDEVLTIETEKLNYVYKIENLKSVKIYSKKDSYNIAYKKLLLEFQDENTIKLFYVELRQDKGVLNLNKNMDIIYNKLDKLIKSKKNRIYYEKMNLSKLVSMKEQNILSAKEILLNKGIELEAVLSSIIEKTYGTEVRLSTQGSKEFSANFIIKDEEEKEKIKKYKIGDKIIINGILEYIFEGIYCFRDVIIGKIEIEKKDEEKILEDKFPKENLKQEETMEDNYEQLKSKILFFISSMKVFIYNAKEWFNSLKKFQKIILFFLIWLSIGINFYTRNSIFLKEKEIKNAQKKYNEAIEKNKKISNEDENENANNNSEEKPIVTTETTSVNNDIEETGTIEDIKNEIKLEIKEQARNEGIQLTEEQIDKLVLYKMQKNMIENLQNDPELRREIENAINNSN